MLSNASISCWGQNDDGEMGGSTGSDQLTPVTALLPTGRTATEISGGWHHACAVLDNGSVSCWGRNDNGQVGIGSIGSDITTPTTSLLPSGRIATKIQGGEEATCALLDNRSVSCWGHNADGQIGLGSVETPQNTPTIVLGVY